MNFDVPNMMLALPEMFVLSMACIILVFDLFVSDKNRILTYGLAQLTLLGALFLTLADYGAATQLTFNGSFIRDPMSDLMKTCIYLAVSVTFLYSKDYLRQNNLFKGEFFVLGLFGLLGMMIMVSAHSLLTLYLGLELLSLTLYAMVALKRDSMMASEAAMKYFILGAIASGMLLYGMSMLYGVTGSLDLAEISQKAPLVKDQILLVFGLVFIMVGVAFKLGAVPFHMWLPDVYHGAPTAVTLYISSAPKIAAFAMLMRLLVDGLYGLHDQWQGILIILAVLSMGIGNIVAIAQTNIKRMFAYSAISHVGFLLLGVLTGTESGFAASMFYVLTYVLMALGGFGMIILLSRDGFEAENLNDFKGLNERSPWYALMMLILIFSMAGVPPFLGFWAKLSVLKEVVAVDLVWLAITAVIFSIIGAFYYLRVIKVMYFDKAEDHSSLACSIDMRAMIALNSILVLVIGLIPDKLMALCASAISGS